VCGLRNSGSGFSVCRIEAWLLIYPVITLLHLLNRPSFLPINQISTFSLANSKDF
jgi:hypothetical protein